MGELLKYGGEAMVLLIEKLFSSFGVRSKCLLIIVCLKKGDREQPGNYRGITLLKLVFCKILI